MIIMSSIVGIALIPVNYSYYNYKNNYQIANTIQKSNLVKKEIYQMHMHKIFFTKCSWYGESFQGRKMANGNLFNMNDSTIVAHKSFPFGTPLRITNPINGKSIIVTVQDRGPYIAGRDIDLSYAAAKKLGVYEIGVAMVKMEVLRT
jgi:rare lipoprotein A (peptidoglycan hydrolase)